MLLCLTGDGGLRDAVASGNAQQVRALLDAGASPDERDALGRTLLHEAVWQGHAEVVRILIARGADVKARHEDGGSTPLDYAALRGDQAIAAILISAGAPVDPEALTRAASRDDAGMVRLLLEAGAEIQPEARNEAVRHGALKALGLLLEGNPGAAEALLGEALRRGDGSLVRVLAAHGADVNRRNSFGATPLHDAAASGNLALVQALLDCGAAINARETENGATPLYEAAAMGRTDVVGALLERGADASLTDRAGRRAAEAASRNGFAATAAKISEKR